MLTDEEMTNYDFYSWMRERGVELRERFRLPQLTLSQQIAKATEKEQPEVPRSMTQQTASFSRPEVVIPPPNDKMILPFFVYGSLKKGYHNHSVIEKYVADIRPAALLSDKFVMYDLGAYPALVLDPNSTGMNAIGEIIHIKKEDYEKAREALDQLESVDRGYYKRLMTPAVADGDPSKEPVLCWTYVAGHDTATRARHNLAVIKSGEWQPRAKTPVDVSPIENEEPARWKWDPTGENWEYGGGE